MKGNEKRKVAIGLALLFLSTSVLAVDSRCENNENEAEKSETMIIKYKTPTCADCEEKKGYINTNSPQQQVTAFKKEIPISKEISDTLVEDLQELKVRIEASNSQREKIGLYSNCLELFIDHGILPESFTIDTLLKTTQELTLNLYENQEKLPNFLKNRLPNSNIAWNDKKSSNNYVSLNNNIDPGDFRLDIGSAFFVFSILSEMIPFNIVPNPPADGDVIVFNLTDFPIGETLVELFPYLKSYKFPVGWVLRPFGFTEILFSGNAIIGGQTLLTWPDGEPMYTFLYIGSSIIIPITFMTGSITVLLDRGPKQVQVPLFDIGIFASALTVHMPYSRDI